MSLLVSTGACCARAGGDIYRSARWFQEIACALSELRVFLCEHLGNTIFPFLTDGKRTVPPTETGVTQQIQGRSPPMHTAVGRDAGRGQAAVNLDMLRLGPSLWVTQGSGPRPLRGVCWFVGLESSSRPHPSGRPGPGLAPSWALTSREPELCHPRTGHVSQAPGAFLFGAPLSALWRLFARQRGWTMNEVVSRFWVFCPLSRLFIIYFSFNHCEGTHLKKLPSYATKTPVV